MTLSSSPARARVVAAFSAALLAAATARASAQPRETPASPLRVAFELDDARIYVPVSDATGPIGSFILDTGAQPTVVDSTVSSRWRATELSSHDATGAGSRTTRTETIAGRWLSVGGVPYEPASLVSAPLNALLASVSGRQVAGIVGSEFFRRHTVTVDFDHRQLIVGPAGGPLDTAGSVLPLSIRDGVPHVRGSLGLPGGRRLPADFLVDLGAKGNVLVAEAFLDRTRLAAAFDGPGFTASLGAGLGGRTRYRFVRLPEISVESSSSARWANVVVGLSVDGTIRSTDFDALLGLDLLQANNLTFDYAGSRLVLSPRASPQAPSEIDLSGLFLVEEGKPAGIRIDEVVAGSPAAAAGLDPGDMLLEVDGRPVSALSLSRVREILRSEPGRLVLLAVRRRDRTFTATLTLRRMA